MAHRHVETVIPPEHLWNKEFWDIGYVNPKRGQFIKINAMSEDPIERKTHTRFFMNLFKQLNQTERFNIKKEFGFNLVNAVFKFDDFHMVEPKFIDMLGDLEVSWISEKVQNDEKIEKRQHELKKFFKHLANACKNFRGEISLKKLRILLEPQIAVAGSMSST